MSIDAYILIQKDNLSENLYTPIMSKEFYNKYLISAIEANQLNWLKGIAVGIDVDKKNLSCILKELSLLKEWTENNLEKKELDYFNERISRLKSMLDKAFLREDVVVFIG
jgi:hypothetical protein